VKPETPAIQIASHKMTHRKPPTSRQDFIEDIRQKQQNTLWPDTLRNSRSVDSFLWNGDPNPSRVQRIAAWLLGLASVGFGVLLLDLARTGGGWLCRIMASAALLLGLKMFRNGFRRKSDFK
jgi:hypothetical protein